MSGYHSSEYFISSTRKYYSKLNLVISAPIKRTTPYGGQLEWKLPAGNKLIAHLKDKTKIRHKKRWSQVGLLTRLLYDINQLINQ